MRTAEQYYIFTLEEPEQVCRGNAKQWPDIKPGYVSDPRPLQQILDEQEAAERVEDEWLKSKGII